MPPVKRYGSYISHRRKILPLESMSCPTLRRRRQSAPAAVDLRIDHDRAARAAGGVALLAALLTPVLVVKQPALARGHDGLLASVHARPAAGWADATGRAQGSSSKVSAQPEQ